MDWTVVDMRSIRIDGRQTETYKTRGELLWNKWEVSGGIYTGRGTTGDV